MPLIDWAHVVLSGEQFSAIVLLRLWEILTVICGIVLLSRCNRELKSDLMIFNFFILPLCWTNFGLNGVASAIEYRILDGLFHNWHD